MTRRGDGRALERAEAMGRAAGEFFRDYGIPHRNPFRPSLNEVDLAAAWRRGYLEALGAGASR